jgi:hypothetical protein
MTQDSHEVLGQIPTIEQDHAEGQFVSNASFHQLKRQVDFGTKSLVQGLKLWVSQQDRINYLVQLRALFLLLGMARSGK